jgi:hypothetical protein
MLNRLNTAASEALDARRAIAAELRERLREVPASPIRWADFDGTTADLRLAAFASMLCTAPARSSELRALWKECVVTAAFALRIAPRLRADPNDSAIAALLHRLGDMLTLRAIGAAEHATRVRLDGPTRSELCAIHGGEQLERVVRDWAVPPRAAATAAEWRRLREFPSAAAEAATVYLARLFAIERISPQFCAPGVLEHAMEEAGLDVRVADEIRGDAGLREWLGGLDASAR